MTAGSLHDGGLPPRRRAASTFLHDDGRPRRRRATTTTAATTAGVLHSDDGLHSLPDGGDLHSLLWVAASFSGRGGIY
jgi:hypothetical protein